MITLVHPICNFLTDNEINYLFEGSKFNSFCDRIEELVLSKYPQVDGDEGELNERLRNKLKGDLLELFVEYLLKLNGNDTRIGISSYVPISDTDNTDYGVDGVGRSIVNNGPATVQVKYRHYDCIITQNDGRLGNFFQQSCLDFFFKEKEPFIPTDNLNMLVITSGKGLHYSIQEISKCTVRCIARDELRQLTDNVSTFWIGLRDAVKASRVKLQTKPLIPLRQHQIVSVNAVIDDIQNGDGIGQIILPTGTGKTYIQAELIYQLHTKFGHKIFVILSPRILLSFQLLYEVSRYLLCRGLNAEYLNLNSGTFDESIVNEERLKSGQDPSRIQSTTNSRDISLIANACTKPLIISCTYHSASRIREAGIIVDSQLNDEAHNMVSSDFGDCHGIGKHEFSFTATSKDTESDNGLGMNNEQLWGNVIHVKRPKELIQVGEILPVMTHVVSLPINQNRFAADDYNSITRLIRASFIEHSRQLALTSADPSAIGAKLLIAVDGQLTMKGILQCDAYREFANDYPDVYRFLISSDLGSYINDIHSPPSSISKDKMLRQLQALGTSEKAVIIHINMLGEGIDVPGITGFLPLRGVEETTFRQSIGRAMRLEKSDRDRFYGGYLPPAIDIAERQYTKPYAYLVVPNVAIGGDDAAAGLLRSWSNLTQDYGPLQFVVSSFYRGINYESNLDDVNQLDRRIVGTNTGIDEFVHEIIHPEKWDIDRLWMTELYLNLDARISRAVHARLFDTSFETIQTVAEWHKSHQDDIKTMLNNLKSRSRNSGQGIYSNEIKKKFGTIYTPEFVVEKTVDLALKWYSGDPLAAVWCDPAVGDGNFLAYIYHKLMGMESTVTEAMSVAEKSWYILTKCLHGYDVLNPMVTACKIRLLLLHLESCDGVSEDRVLDLLGNLNVYCGNTICLPEDTKELWYNQRQEYEGGLLAGDIRGKKFDIIVGNPPYTHLRNMQNRRYASYPKQRDMAQVFVRWALDHITETGICSFNTIDTWLNVKTNDGANLTRVAINCRLREILQDDLIMRYSEDRNGEGGGEIPTCIICFGAVSSKMVVFDNKDYQYTDDELLAPGFINNLRYSSMPYPFRYVMAYDYIETMRGVRSDNRHNSKCSDRFIFRDLGDGDNYYLVSKEGIYEHTYKDNWRLIRGSVDAVVDLVVNSMTGEIKLAKVTERNIALWLLGFFKTDHSKAYVHTYCKSAPNHGGWMVVLASGRFASCRVPDYNWYLKNWPDKTNAFLNWIEINMYNKDVFLAGIDEQFELLISERSAYDQEKEHVRTR